MTLYIDLAIRNVLFSNKYGIVLQSTSQMIESDLKFLSAKLMKISEVNNKGRCKDYNLTY